MSNPIEGWTLYEHTQDENKHNLRPNYYEDLEKDYADRPDLLRTLVRGEWGITVRGKQVYPEFDRKIHISKEPLKPAHAVLVLVGWDNTGLSPSISLSYINNIGQWLVFKEFTFSNVGIADATEILIVWCATNLHQNCKYRHIGDPAGFNRDSTKKSPADYISGKARDYGQVIEIERGIQTFKIRRESVANRLGHVKADTDGRVTHVMPRMINDDAPALLIDPSCTRLTDGFEGGYAYPEIGNSGVFGTSPKKPDMYTDIQDSLQYVATIIFPVNRARRAHDTMPESSGDSFAGYM